MNISSICIFTQSPLTSAPRVVKEANVYAKNGYNVTVYAPWFSHENVEKDQNLLHSKVSYKASVNLVEYNPVYPKTQFHNIPKHDWYN